MATEDSFDPGNPLPHFLSADESDQSIGKDETVISLRGLMASLLVAAAIGAGFALLSNRVTLFADATASLVDKSAPQPATDQSTPIIQSDVVQSATDAEALPPIAKDAPSREISASEPASQTKTENGEASSGEASHEALFREYQAWAAEQDARALAKPVEDPPAPVLDSQAPVQPGQKQRRARSVHNTRAEIRRVQERRAYVRQQNERIQVRSVQDARAQAQPVQNAEPPSFLDSLNPFGASRPQR